MINKANKSFKNNRSKPKYYTETALFLSYLLTARRRWPNAHLVKWAFGQF